MNLILSLLIANSAPGAVSPHALAAEILLVAAEYHVDAETLTRIVILESGGREKAFNKKTQDYGIIQANIKTIHAYGSSVPCAMQWTCGLRLGARILHDMQKYAKSDRTCHYNVGPKSLSGARLRNCLKYEQKLASIN